MDFLDRKEQVIDLQLTQYGKHLLSRGEFDPVFYQFFDDDVLYDAECGGVIEVQNSSSVRIKTTPKLVVQTTYSGVETELSKLYQTIRQNEITDEGISKFLARNDVQVNADKHYSSVYPLGTMRLDGDKKPAWNVNVFIGDIDDVNPFKSGEHPSLRIPQLNFEDVEFIIEIAKNEPLSDLELFSQPFADGSFVKITEDGILLEINEEDVPFDNENFDVEVFEILDENGKEVLIPLFFQQKAPQVVNDILLDNEAQSVPSFPLDPSFAEFFFDVKVDREIDPEIICKSGVKEHPDEFFMSQLLLCQDLERKERDQKLYDTDVVLEDLEECEK